MNDKVKVGLDEWIVADASKVDLMTDGLAGCVAVGVAKGGKLALSHVYSDCTEANWDAYKAKLDSALAASGMADLSGTKAVLVCSQGGDAVGKQAWLPNQLKTWLEEKGAEVAIQKDNGCHITAAGGDLTCMLKKDAPDARFSSGYLTSSDEAPTTARHRISAETKAAGLPALSQAERDYAGPRLSEAAHPANALYTAILAKMPEDCDSPQVAAALTVSAMKKGMTGADDVALGVGANADRLFVSQGGVAGKCAFVEVGQVEDVSMKTSSQQASALHVALAPPVVAPVAEQVVVASSGAKSM